MLLASTLSSQSLPTCRTPPRIRVPRVGHLFATHYEARLDLNVYESLLDLVSKTATELAELKPRDHIDVQSFIWVVGDYKEESERPQP